MLSKKYEKITVCDIEVLAIFTGNDECLSVEMVVATKSKGLKFVQCLLPHDWSPIRYDQSVPSGCKAKVICLLERWINGKLLKPTEWEATSLHYFHVERGFAEFVALDECVPVSSVNLVDEYCKSCSIATILSPQVMGWFTAKERQEFVSRCDRWFAENQDYLRHKSFDFALFWVEKVGTEGSSGDLLIDSFRFLLEKRDTNTLSGNDTTNFAWAVYNHALSDFMEGRIPFLSTDYGIDYNLKRVLEGANLMHMAGLFPIKTWLHLEFDDLDKSALFPQSAS